MTTETITLGHTRGSGIAIPAPILAIASDWHGGQSSMLYAIASTGGLTLARDWPDMVEALDILGGLWWKLAKELESGPVPGGDLANVWALFCRDVSAALEDAGDQLHTGPGDVAGRAEALVIEGITTDAVRAIEHIDSHVSKLLACAHATTVVDAMAMGADPWAHADWVGEIYGIAGSELMVSDPWSVLLNPLALESRDGEHASIVFTSGGPHHELRWPFGKPAEAVYRSVLPLFHEIETGAGSLLVQLATRVDAALPALLDPQDTMPDDTPREIMLTLFTAGTMLAESNLP